MNAKKIFSIGKTVNNEEKVCIEPEAEYAPGLKGPAEYGRAMVLWRADGCDNGADRHILTEKKPCRHGPEETGVFALRSPERPNPIAVSSVEIAYVNKERGTAGLYCIDARDGTEALDIKPCTPSLGRIAQPRTPARCSGRPQSYEESGAFDREAEFNF